MNNFDLKSFYLFFFVLVMNNFDLKSFYFFCLISGRSCSHLEDEGGKPERKHLHLQSRSRSHRPQNSKQVCNRK
jgi:hypothetical protein